MDNRKKTNPHLVVFLLAPPSVDALKEIGCDEEKAWDDCWHHSGFFFFLCFKRKSAESVFHQNILRENLHKLCWLCFPHHTIEEASNRTTQKRKGRKASKKKTNKIRNRKEEEKKKRERSKMSRPNGRSIERLSRLSHHTTPKGTSTNNTDGSRTTIGNCFSSTAVRLIEHPQVQVNGEVKRALLSGRAVVALESTIISHGMPFPQNFETAREVETVVRNNGATPATIAILDGKVHVGLDEADLLKLAKLGKKCHKVSRRDIAYVMSRKENGATTVAATMYLANLVGIKVFVTGGIGGVHRGVEHTLDISADLTELGRTPVAVVCAGVKSILDIPRTLEYLETQGVSVVTYGAKEFPAFFTAHSGLPSPLSMNSTLDIAKLISAGSQVELSSGQVVAVPIPEDRAADSAAIQKAIATALTEANDKNIKGKNITPFLLQRVNELTGGKSLESNIALVKNNAAIGSQIAVHLANITSTPGKEFSSAGSNPGVPVVVGGSNQDIIGHPAKGTKLLMHTSNPGVLNHQWGGVGRNIAECMGRLDTTPLLVTAVGQDAAGDGIVESCRAAGVTVLPEAIYPGLSTPTYVAIMDEHGDLHTTIADMQAMDNLSPHELQRQLHTPVLANCPFLVLDANVTRETQMRVGVMCAEHKIPLWYEPVGVAKSVRCVPLLQQGYIQYISPNVDELVAIAHAMHIEVPVGISSVHFSTPSSDYRPLAKSLRMVMKACPNLLAIVLTIGARGVLLACRETPKQDLVEVIHYPAIQVPVVENTSGAGDTMVGAIVAQLLRGVTIQNSIPFGIAASSLTLLSPANVSVAMSQDALTRSVSTYREKRTVTHIS